MGRSSKTLLIIVGVVVVLLCLKVAINIANRPDDPKLIQTALDDAIKQSREGRTGGILDVLSDSLKVNNSDQGANIPKILDFVRQQHPDMHVDDPTPQITGGGDEARIVSPVEIDLGLGRKTKIPEMTLIFRKEDATEYLVIPTRKWRLTQVFVPDSTIAEFVSGYSAPLRGQ